VNASAANPLDIRWVRRSFDRAAATYDAAAVLQSEVRKVLLARLDLTALDPRVVLDAGAGTGHASRALKRRYPGARVVALDFALGMLRVAAGQRTWFRPFARVCADAARLPLPDGSVDLIVSNFMLAWADPGLVFAECRRVLAPRGLLTFTSLGPDTLRELRAAWAQVDAHSRVHSFLDMHEIGDAMVHAGLAAPVLDVERYTVSYIDVRGLAADLKALGTHNAAADRLKGLTSPRKFAAMQAAYERYRHEGRLPATYEVVFGQAWAPEAPRGAIGEDNRISLQDVKRQLRRQRAS
jgi:malonyl-CoA O-methyltransferase